MKKWNKDGVEIQNSSLTGITDTNSDIWGTFKLKRGEKLAITGAPVGTEYYIEETDIPSPYTQCGT